MQLRLTFFFATLLLLATVHIVALKLYLYWQFPWFDVPMHVLGGVCAAFGYGILPYLRLRKYGRAENLWWFLSGVMTIGVVWELFEYGAGISGAGQDNFALDTTLDLLMDLVGGTIGYGVIKSMRMLSQ